jgi:hypothetical protein
MRLLIGMLLYLHYMTKCHNAFIMYIYYMLKCQQLRFVKYYVTRCNNEYMHFVAKCFYQEWEFYVCIIILLIVWLLCEREFELLHD